MNLPTLIKKPLVGRHPRRDHHRRPASGVLYVAGRHARGRHPAGSAGRSGRRPRRGEPGGRGTARFQLHGAEVRPRCSQHRCRHQGPVSNQQGDEDDMMTMAAATPIRSAQQPVRAVLPRHPADAAAAPARGGLGLHRQPRRPHPDQRPRRERRSEVTVRLTDRREFTGQGGRHGPQDRHRGAQDRRQGPADRQDRRLARPEGRRMGAGDRLAVRLREHA